MTLGVQTYGLPASFKNTSLKYPLFNYATINLKMTNINY